MPVSSTARSRVALSLAVAAAALLAACASTRRSDDATGPCTDPDDSAQVAQVSAQVGARIYGACEVDRPARRVANVRSLQPENLPDITRPCLAAVFDLVVDTEGRVLPAPLDIVSTNSPPFALELRRKTAGWRFRPAEKGGAKVPQLTRDTIVFSFQGSRYAMFSSTYGAIPRCPSY